MSSEGKEKQKDCGENKNWGQCSWCLFYNCTCFLITSFHCQPQITVQYMSFCSWSAWTTDSPTTSSHLYICKLPWPNFVYMCGLCCSCCNPPHAYYFTQFDLSEDTEWFTKTQLHSSQGIECKASSFRISYINTGSGYIYSILLMVQIVDHLTRVMTSVDLLQPSHVFFKCFTCHIISWIS